MNVCQYFAQNSVFFLIKRQDVGVYLLLGIK
jgi:hypothetical protein